MADTEQKKEANNTEEKKAEVKETPPVETQHKIKVGRKTLSYKATAGMMPLKDKESGEIKANVYFTAYTLDDVKNVAERPLTIVFNGGPGSASVWLHLGALGPRRVKMQGNEGWMPVPPFQLVDNEQTWLDMTDLVFVDPVGTGFSRSTKSDYNKEYWNLDGDLKSLAEVIRLYLTRYGRWSSPLFLAGESYGTTRSAGLAGRLIDMGIALNGIMLISTILYYQTVDFEPGNDLPFALYLPTYAAAAWYHKKLAKNLQDKALADLLAEVEEWALGEYSQTLMQGDRLSEKDRESVIRKLAGYTGLDRKFIENSRLRINIMRFCKELLRDQHYTVGRLDSRYKGYDTQDVGDTFDFDPSLSAITPPFTAMMNDYARRTLGFETDTAYETLSFDVNRAWEWERGKFPETANALRSAFAKNPYMRVMVAQGYYDLATPHFAAEYTFDHMDIHPDQRNNFHFTYYEAGHMMYLHLPSLEKLKQDVVAFIENTLKKD
jgi:carboxypeptidase C (cathepsin A)